MTGMPLQCKRYYGYASGRRKASRSCWLGMANESKVNSAASKLQAPISRSETETLCCSSVARLCCRMSCEEGGDVRKHVLLFPYPAQGHMLPMLDMAEQLVRRGLAVTILVTPKNLEILKPLLSVHPGIRTLVLPFPGHPKIPEGVENVKDIGNHGNVPMLNAMGKLHEGIVEWFKGQEEGLRPVAIVSDFFLGWTERLGKEVGVPRVAFYSLSALLMEVSCYLWKDVDHLLSLDAVDFEELPGKPVFKHGHLPTIVRQYKKSDPDWEFIKDSFTVGFSSFGVVFNTFDDLDSKYLDHCRKNMMYQRTWAVGPLKLMKEPGELDAGPRSKILEWLDGCPDRSVVYVCFGSQKMLSREQMEALAKGLELSGSRFLWGVKQATTAAHMDEGFGSVPEAFEERVSERGKVVRGWVPQEAVLNHRAVAYFLSHCGWNSVLEAVVGGVGILAWPMEADQFVNAKILVEEKGVAVLVCEGADTVPDPDTLARTIAEAVSGDQASWLRAKELSDKAHKAAEAGGSSAVDLDRLVEELTQLDMAIVEEVNFQCTALAVTCLSSQSYHSSIGSTEILLTPDFSCLKIDSDGFVLTTAESNAAHSICAKYETEHLHE